MTPINHLHRSKTDKMITGLVGGVAEYFHVNSALVRLIWVLVVVFTGFFPGVVVYAVGIVVVPKSV